VYAALIPYIYGQILFNSNRRSLKRYYDNNMNYAKHHIDPVCRSAIAILRSYKKNNNGELKIIEAKKLSMRIDSELTRIENNKLRITIRPNEYEYIPIVTKIKHLYSRI